MINETESVTKKVSHQRTLQRQMASLLDTTKHFKHELLPFFNCEENLENYKSNITLSPKPENDPRHWAGGICDHYNYKILNKIPANKIQQYASQCFTVRDDSSKGCKKVQCTNRQTDEAKCFHTKI